MEMAVMLRLEEDDLVVLNFHWAPVEIFWHLDQPIIQRSKEESSPCNQ